MIRKVVSGFMVGIIFGFISMVNVSAAFASWTTNHCDAPGNGFYLIYQDWSRADARSYAVWADGDGYEWGGGCWNGNGVDDTPNAPDSGGEGGDCSGFTFKSWAMATDWSATQYYHHPLWPNHGPYTANSFRTGTGAPQVKAKGYGDTSNMDAFASTTHIGMIYTEQSSGYDLIVEAKGDAAGTGVWQRGYRSNTAYAGVGRTNWAS